MFGCGGRRASLALLALAACEHHAPAAAPEIDAGPPPPATFQAASDAALATLTNVFYADGNWRLCVPNVCGILAYDDFDWGADAMTYTLYLRWTTSHDASIPAMMTALDANGATYGTCTASACDTWSDVPLWDSIAASREYQVTGAASSLARAKGAFAYVDGATQFALGACPTVDYQLPAGQTNDLKTLESDSNYVKAALLLSSLTSDATYLTKAVAKYAAIRQYFLDPVVPLYTVYVFDDGHTCTQVPHRFYASVNGNMIWNGVTLAGATGQSSYMADALATAQAVAANLDDANGVFADLQTDDDVVEPLVEAMLLLATDSQQGFAHDWILTNAAAMAAARAPTGAYGRFFDGPSPTAQVTEWQANGGLSLAIAAGALDPMGDAAANAGAWSSVVDVADDLSTLPSTVQFTGSAIAFFGTMGENCCQLGQAEVLVDGVETFNEVGIHQNESNALGRADDVILFAWRWPTSGAHTIAFQPATPDAKEGGPFLHVQHYQYVP
jgi:hypothetical protein